MQKTNKEQFDSQCIDESRSINLDDFVNIMDDIIDSPKRNRDMMVSYEEFTMQMYRKSVKPKFLTTVDRCRKKNDIRRWYGVKYATC